MAKVGAQRAAELTGKSKSTIQRAMNAGKVSYEMDSNGRRVIDVSELDRAFGLKQATASANQNSVERELEKATTMIEMERMKMRIKMLEQQLETANTQIEDLQNQRDQWQKQASQMLITSQHSQKQADELRAEMKEREERARMRKQKMLEQKMKKMQAENENTDTESSDSMGGFQGFWKKVKGA